MRASRAGARRVAQLPAEPRLDRARARRRPGRRARHDHARLRGTAVPVAGGGPTPADVGAGREHDADPVRDHTARRRLVERLDRARRMPQRRPRVLRAADRGRLREAAARPAARTWPASAACSSSTHGPTRSSSSPRCSSRLPGARPAAPARPSRPRRSDGLAERRTNHVADAVPECGAEIRADLRPQILDSATILI